MTISCNEILQYYAEPGSFTAARGRAGLLSGLPETVPDLVRLVQNLTIHVFWAQAYGLKIPDERMGELQMRGLWQKLERISALDPRPLSTPRALECKLVSNCRDITLLLVGFLRAKGIPARARCGFGTYFIPGHYEDHWVAEVWDRKSGRWQMIDAQIDALMRDRLGIDFDTLDLPEGKFVPGGKAWKLCRADQANPDDFGIAEYKGWDFVRGDLLRDVLAFNKVEVLPWDFWGILAGKSVADSSAGELAYLDHLAELAITGDAAVDELREEYERNPGLQVPVEWMK